MFTSNVDNQFQKAGYKNVLECHGSIFHFQCDNCFLIEERRCENFELNTEKFESKHVPKCSCCKKSVRPNILMFGDSEWMSQRTDDQTSSFRKWLFDNTYKKKVIVEMGAGNGVPTIRYQSEELLRESGS